MPATVGDILKTKPELITTTPDLHLHLVLELMIRYDYSQLPVLDGEGCPIGIVTSDGIVRALHHFGALVRQPKKDDAKEAARRLRVVDAMERQVQLCKPDTEVFTVHRQLRDSSCVLVVDGKGVLKGIITGFDTTEYLRQRVQDIVFVQDIEERLKDYVRLAFRSPEGHFDQHALQAAIVAVTSGVNDRKKQLMPLLHAYLKLRDGDGVAVDNKLAEQALAQVASKQKELDFDLDLTIANYIQLFVNYGLPKYGVVFQLDRATIETMLASVNHTRNDLAHLRIDISARQRDELRLCRDWLEHYYHHARALVITASADAVEQAPDSTPATLPIEVAASLDAVEADAEVVNGSGPLNAEATVQQQVVDEASTPGESLYAPLGQYLFNLPERLNQVPMTFQEIERLIGSELPPSAREYRSWWGNDSSRHPQAEQWLSAGWRVDEVDRERGRVTFTRITPRERSYADFFDLLYKDLKPEASFLVFQPSQVGYHWQNIARVPDGKPGEGAGIATFSFTRNRRPRVDLYIDTGDQKRNKEIFDALKARREGIEATFGGSLEWERMSENRASRIAVYYDDLIDIGAQPHELSELRRWATETLIRLKKALDEPARQVMDKQLAQKSSKTPTLSR